ncbi:MAG: class I SAM-dependent methyltransferase [Bacteroidia bacterium]|nr:class I SAM-dependent methyltransferase [Bacteroidia bacterium]
MIFNFLEYLKFIFGSTNKHGIHSPFVFDLVTKCFFDRKEYESYKIIKDYRKQLYHNHDKILIKDYGAGSKVFKSNTREVSQVAKTSGITKKRARLLYRITQYIKPNRVLELGTSLGMSTSAMSLGNPNASILTVEGCPETAAIAKNQFKFYQLNNITLKVNDFKTELKKLKNEKFDLIYLDGNHQKDATINYFETLIKSVNDRSVVIVDDIHWSKGMTEAWELIKQNQKVTVTIDTFYWGIIFFRKEQVKQNFKIRV